MRNMHILVDIRLSYSYPLRPWVSLEGRFSVPHGKLLYICLLIFSHWFVGGYEFHRKIPMRTRIGFEYWEIFFFRRAALELHICPGRYLETPPHPRSHFKSLVFLEIVSEDMGGTNKLQLERAAYTPWREREVEIALHFSSELLILWAHCSIDARTSSPQPNLVLRLRKTWSGYVF